MHNIWGILLPLLLLCIAVVFSLSLFKLRNMTTSKLDQLLYVDGNYEAYLGVLNNNKLLKLLYPKGSLEHLRLNAYLLLSDDTQINNSIKKIDSLHLNKGECIDYNLQKLSYYATRKDKDNAQLVIGKLEKLVDRKHNDILNDAKIVYRLYIEEDEKLFEELEDIAHNQKELNRGITYFRLARLSFVKGDNDKMLQYLSKAKKLLKNTIYQSIIDDIYKDHSLILKY